MIRQALLAAALAAGSAGAQPVLAPHHGDVLFQHFQGRWAAALGSLMTSQHFERLAPHDAEAELLRGGLLLDWGQITFPDLLKGAPPSLTWNGYRYRYYEPTQTYVGIKQGRVYLYQPASSPDIQPLPAIGDYLPQAMRDLQGRRPLAATASPR